MAVDMFLRLGDIKGDSADSTHGNEIDVLAWSWGMSQSASTHHATGGGSGKANVQDLSITKRIDNSTPNLIKFCCIGQHFTDAQLTCRKAGKTPLEYLIIKFKDLVISSVHTGGSNGGDILTENVSLNFASFEVKYVQQASGTGGKNTDFIAGFNIAQNVGT